ncbi:MAG: phytanoyl-CoA dioxygenase family protein [Acidobacteriota bacterium]
MTNQTIAVQELESIAKVRAEDISFYDRHGWIVSPQPLPHHLLDGALQGLEQHWAGHRDHVLPGDGTGFGDWMPGDSSATRNNEYLSLQNTQVRTLALSPVIGAVAGALTGSRAIRLFDDQMVYKPGGQQESVVGWHVDGDYWGTCSSQNMLTAWIPLHDCPEELGPLVVLDGSHRWSHLIERSKLSFHKRDMQALARLVNDLGFEFKPVVIELQRGQFSFHHSRTIHGSYPNRGSRPRIAFAAHLQDGDNAYKAAFRSDGRPIELFNDRICSRDIHGMPDYEDPNVFPVLWSR